MKLAIIAALAVSGIGTAADAQTRVRGYVKRDGTYVMPHVRSSPNRTTTDNWTVRPNYNPYTGQAGTQQPTYQPRTPTYSNPYTTQPKRCTGYFC